MFGAGLAAAAAYARLLAGDGARRGVIGPREAERIWTRHLLNCAVVAEVIPHGARVVDVGSGAGLPGLAIALARPDLSVDLVEPLLRRTTFLTDVVGALELADRVRVVRGRADESAVRVQVAGAEVVTARAVAPLDRLVRWCLPLVASTGHLLALKGATADAEVAEHAQALASLGATADVIQCGVGTVSEPTTIVRVTALTGARPARRAEKGRR